MIMFGTNIQSADSMLTKIQEADLFQRLTQPDADLAARVRQLRIAYQIAPKQYSEQKRSLPFVVCGIFNPPYRKTENFGYTDRFIVDIDHLGSKGITISQLKARLRIDDRILMFFASPSEDGLKVMFRFKERCYDAGLYALFYKEFLQKFSAQYQLEQVADKRTSDVTRACFLSVDTDAYFNNDCEPVDMGLYVHSANPLAMFDQLSKQKKEERKMTGEAEKSSPNDPEKEIMERIKQCLNPSAKSLRKKTDAFVPDQLNSIMDYLVAYIEDTGLVVSEVIDIQYGKKIRISMGQKQAEINLFYGRKGFSVVKSPRSGTSAELNDITAQLIQTFIYQL